MKAGCDMRAHNAFVWVAVLGLLASPAVLQADGEYGFVEAWVSGGRCGSDAEHTGIHEYSSGPGEASGYGPQQIDGSVSSFPMTGPIGTTVAGWAGGKAEARVDPVDGQIRTRAHAYSSGCGPTRYEASFMGRTYYFPWSGNFGSAFSRGYVSNTLRIEPGTSGLAAGDTAQLALSVVLDGNIALNAVEQWEPAVHVYLGSQVTDITDAPPGELPHRQHVWTSKEGEIHLGSNTYPPEQLDDVVGFHHVATENTHPFVAEDVHGEFPMAGDLEIAANGDIDHESGQLLVDVVVGNWYRLEFYLECDVQLPNHPGEYTTELHIDPETGFPVYSSLYGTADFLNTLECGLDPAPGYEGIDMVYAPVPEPMSLLLISAGVSLVAVRRSEPSRSRPGRAGRA